MRYRWSLLPAHPARADDLARQAQVSPLLAQCLLNRGFAAVEAARAFLQPRLKDLADPFAVPGMDAAVARLFQARERGERVTIFGDYDVDGVTATALLHEVLRALGWPVDCYLPHRLDEGYGLSRDGIENCLRRFPATLLLAVDCGSTAVDAIAWLRQQGVDVIVLDHHQMPAPAPAAAALVNPRARRLAAPAGPEPQLEDAPGRNGPSDFTELCSAGLAFKLAHALVKRGRETGLPGADRFDLRPLLDLVALGTVADIVPLVGENRVLVAAGLARLNTTRRPGLVALKQVAQTPPSLGAYEVGFQLGPRLNAAGRLQTAEDALRLLQADELAAATPLAQRLDARNRERQKIERGILDEAVAAIRPGFRPEADFVIVQARPHWHLGVVGIVASRVLQQFYRPTLILGREEGEWRGSGRSIPGFDLAAALRECGDLLVRHGGHALAAGLALRAENLAPLRERLNLLARRALTPEALQPALRLEAAVRLGDLTLDTLAELDRLEPTGQGNPPVRLLARNLRLRRPVQWLGPEQCHAKLWVADDSATHEAVWWNVGDQPLPTETFDLAFAPQLNCYQGRPMVQLKVLAWRPAG